VTEAYRCSGDWHEVFALWVSIRILLNWHAGGPAQRVFLHSGLKFWFPLPGNGRREVGQLPSVSTWQRRDAGGSNPRV
jgi:hypothetical protein